MPAMSGSSSKVTITSLPDGPLQVDGEVEILPIDAMPQEVGDRFAARSGFDPRTLGSRYRWFRVTPRRIQAWREENELAGRELMRDGRWLS